MDNRGSLTTLKVWRIVRQAIFAQMEKGKTTPERSKKILKFVKNTIGTVKNIEDLGTYCAMLGEKYPELAITIDQLRLVEDEKLQTVNSLAIDRLMTAGKIDQVENLLEKIYEGKDPENDSETLKKLFPKEYEEAFKEVFGKPDPSQAQAVVSTHS